MHLTPQALQRVLGPSGPWRHCGVFVAPQLRHVHLLDLRGNGDVGQASKEHCATCELGRAYHKELH